MRRIVSMMSLLVAVTAPQVHAAEISIFDVRRPIALSDNDKPQRDFYLNAGTESGLSAGMVITVFRKTPLYDSYQNRSAGDLMIKVAKVKIIHAQRGLAVARLHSEFSRDNNPVLEDNFLMVGDQIDLASASSDKSASLSEAPQGAPEPVAPTPAPAPASVPETPAPEKPLEAPAIKDSAQNVMSAPKQAAHIIVNSEDVDVPVLQ